MTNHGELTDWFGDLRSEILEGEAEEQSRKWSARKRIYLEGPTDYDIIGIRWFHSNDIIEFRAQDTDEGGCKWVLNQVNEQYGTYGIIDRDYLLNPEYYNLFFEVDDEIYKNQNVFGDNVLILNRHEIENYLVDIHSLLHLIINRKRNLYKDKVITTKDDLCEILLHIAIKISAIDAICSVFRIFRETTPGQIKGLYFNKESAEEVRAEVEPLLREWIMPGAEVDPTPHENNFFECLRECYAQLSDRYDAFDPDEDLPKLTRLLSLLRIIDGKQVVGQIKSLFKLRDPFEYDLADHIAYNGSIPSELKEFIQFVYSNS